MMYSILNVNIVSYQSYVDSGHFIHLLSPLATEALISIMSMHSLQFVQPNPFAETIVVFRRLNLNLT